MCMGRGIYIGVGDLPQDTSCILRRFVQLCWVSTLRRGLLDVFVLGANLTDY